MQACTNSMASQIIYILKVLLDRKGRPDFLFFFYCSQIIHLLNSCCVQEELGNQVVSEGLGYLLIMPSCDVESDTDTPARWTGKKVTVNPTMDTAIGLADIQVMHDDGSFTFVRKCRRERRGETCLTIEWPV